MGWWLQLAVEIKAYVTIGPTVISHRAQGEPRPCCESPLALLGTLPVCSVCVLRSILQKTTAHKYSLSSPCLSCFPKEQRANLSNPCHWTQTGGDTRSRFPSQCAVHSPCVMEPTPSLCGQTHKSPSSLRKPSGEWEHWVAGAVWPQGHSKVVSVLAVTP